MLDIHAPLILQGCTYFADKNVMKGSLLDNLQWYVKQSLGCPFSFMLPFQVPSNLLLWCPESVGKGENICASFPELLILCSDHGENAGEGPGDQGPEEEDLQGGEESRPEVQHGGAAEHDVQSLPEDLLRQSQDSARTGPVSLLFHSSRSHRQRGHFVSYRLVHSGSEIDLMLLTPALSLNYY